MGRAPNRLWLAVLCSLSLVWESRAAEIRPNTPVPLQPIFAYDDSAKAELVAEYARQFDSAMSAMRDYTYAKEFENSLAFVPLYIADGLSGGTTSYFTDEVRREARSKMRDSVVNLLRSNFSRLPETGPIGVHVVHTLLMESQNWNPTAGNVFHTEAIAHLALTVDQLTRQMLVDRGRMDNALSIEDAVKLSADIKNLDKAIHEAQNDAAAGRPNQPPSGTLAAFQKKMADGSRMAQVAGNQLGAAGSIANRLGHTGAARDLGKAQLVANTAANIMMVGANNPLAVLPAIDGVMTVLGVGDSSGQDLSWMVEYFAGLSRQIEDLAAQIQKNHEEVLERLDYLTVLNEVQLRHLSRLLTREAEACSAFIPASWKVGGNAEDLRSDFVDLRKPLIHATYQQSEKAWEAGTASQWTACQKGLSATLFTSNNIVPDEIGVSVARQLPSNTPKSVGRSISAYESVKKAYLAAEHDTAEVEQERLAALRLRLHAPSVTLSNYASEKHLNQAKYIQSVVERPFDPLGSSLLIDPGILERYAGFLLAVYPQYMLVDNQHNFIPKSRLGGEEINTQAVRSALMQALRFTDLSIGQQLMLSGEGLSDTQVPKSRAALIQDYSGILDNFALQLAAANLANDSRRSYFFAAVGARKLSYVHFSVYHWVSGSHDPNDPMEIRHLDGARVWRIGGPSSDLPLAMHYKDVRIPIVVSAGEYLDFRDQSIQYSPHLGRLLFLQARLVQALQGLDVSTREGQVLALGSLSNVPLLAEE